MNRRSIAVLGFASVLLAPAAAHANGFFLYESSPRAVAEGGAVSALGEEPATVVYNPAGMTRLDGLQAQLNLYTYIAANSFESPSGKKTSADTGVFPTPAGFLTYKPIDKVALGIGSYSMYGLALNWPDKWDGYQLVKKASLRSYQVQPSVAFGPVAGLSFGAGLDLIYGSVELSRGLPLGSNNWGTTTIGGSAMGIGANFGLLYEPTDYLRVGLTYRTAATMKLDPGEATFEAPPTFDQQLKGQDVSVSLNLPAISSLGVRVTPFENFQVEADAFLLQWSKYKELNFQFEDPALNSVEPKNWHDAWEYRIGAQYSLDKLALRAGFLWDRTPIPDETLDPTLPDNDRLIPSIGAGYQFTKGFRADLAYHFVYLIPREVDASVNKFPGRYKATVNTIAVGVTFKM